MVSFFVWRVTVQWKLDITKGQGADKMFAKRSFVTSRFFFIYFTITVARNMVRFTEEFVIKMFVKSRFYCSLALFLSKDCPIVFGSHVLRIFVVRSFPIALLFPLISKMNLSFFTWREQIIIKAKGPKWNSIPCSDQMISQPYFISRCNEPTSKFSKPSVVVLYNF